MTALEHFAEFVKLAQPRVGGKVDIDNYGDQTTYFLRDRDGKHFNIGFNKAGDCLWWDVAGYYDA